MAHRECLKASLDGITGVRSEPDKIYIARYDEEGRKSACYTLFAIIPHDKEEELHKAISAVLWPEKEGGNSVNS
jgi:hypothetical protein